MNYLGWPVGDGGWRTHAIGLFYSVAAMFAILMFIQSWDVPNDTSQLQRSLGIFASLWFAAFMIWMTALTAAHAVHERRARAGAHVAAAAPRA